MKTVALCKRILMLVMFLAFCAASPAQDTFSIVAVDSVTGEIGSAGASCVGYTGTYPHGAQIISDVIPGIGSIHTQAAWLSGNQQNAHARMLAGDSPQEIIDWLVANDIQGNPYTRQYGIVDYNNGHPRSAAHTGLNCLNYKNDTAGVAYTIQGNILLGQQILDSIRTRFLNTSGPLADRLMAALQGAKVIGADTRCASPYQSSSLSAFIRVARPGDVAGNFFLDLWMSYPQTWSGPVPVDPIDSLQTLFDQWQISLGNEPVRGERVSVRIGQQEDGTLTVSLPEGKAWQAGFLYLFDGTGKQAAVFSLGTGVQRVNPGPLPPGIYPYRVEGNDGRPMAAGKVLLR